jgi:pimeloyl-ACP methyl ester carboxylesterase
MERMNRNLRIASVIATACALSASAACSSGSSRAEPPAVNVTTTTGAPTTSVPAVQVEQKIPSKTRYVVDGRSVDLECKGRGRIPVVFQAGGRENGAVWNGLVESLGDDVFTCVFNRPGATVETAGRPVTELLTPNVISDALAETLDQAGIGPRVILVGHSAGGTDSIVFGGEYPERVAGAVLFDPSVPSLVPPGEWERIGFDAAATIAQARAVTSWPDVPVVVLTADAKLVIANHEATPAEERAWIAGHRRWAAMSSRGEQREVPNTSHFVYLTAPKVARDTLLAVIRAAS